MQENELKILFVSAEVSPFAKTGGLADVAGSLPQSLAAMGNDVRVVMPKYKLIQSDMSYITDFPVQLGYKKETCIIRETEVAYQEGNTKGSVPVYFVDSYNYFDRDGIYGHHDDAERFAFFCNSILEMLPRINFQPDIIHCNDWHTGPICMLLKEKYRYDSFYSSIKTVFTIHNLEYQGHFPKETIRLFNVGEEVFTSDKVEFYGVFNFMKAGLVYADIISTVSEMYSKEIQTEQYGEGLDGLMKGRSTDLYGIINGISCDEFNPSTDHRIYCNFSFEDISNKGKNKSELQKEMELPIRKVPVISIISRLTGQKGLNLIVDGLDEIMKNDVQFILLGTGDEYFENSFRMAKHKYPDKISIYIGFNAALAQKIYAGSDMFLMPSRYEPCGLGQIISLRYGTIPIVRATGGLADTILDYDSNNKEGNGFSFTGLSHVELIRTIERALKVYKKPAAWEAIVKRALSQDFSWHIPAQKYMTLYQKAIEKKV